MAGDWGLLQRLRLWLIGPAPAPRAPVDWSGELSDLVSIRLLLLGVATLVVLAGYGLTLESGNRLNFIGWLVAAAFAAFLFGAAAGMLFGLPTVRLTETRTAAPAPAADGDTAHPAAAPAKEIPYNESTSLEQISVWLTGVIIGLTLTNFSDWEGRFNVLSANLTRSMYNIPISQSCGKLCFESAKGKVPGGLVLFSFFILGFIISYLWMRRHFVIEMVVARRAAERKFRDEIEKRSQEIRADTETAKAKEMEARSSQERLDQEMRIAELERQKLATNYVDQPDPGADLRETQRSYSDGLATIEAPPLVRAAITAAEASEMPDPNDYWRGRLGGASERDGFNFTATVSETVDPRLFEIQLRVDATNAELKARVAGQERVVFLLHPTFGPKLPQAAFDADGIARLQIFAYGAFTAGAITEEGKTLELNLASIPNVPTLFLQN
jgi:hypothetical protein